MRKRNVMVLIIIPLLYITISGCGRAGGSAPSVVQGELDLSGWNFDENGSVNIDGQWEFYWNRLLAPSDFADGKNPGMTGYYPVPGYWNNYTVNASKLPAQGFATYRVKIILKKTGTVCAFHIPEAISSSSMWINGAPVAASGIVSSDFSKMKPQFIGKIIYVSVPGNTLDVVCQVANNSYRKSGIWRSMTIGSPRIISASHDSRMSIDMFLLGCLLIMALYHLGLYIYRKNDPSPLYFGLFCMVIVIRILTTGEHVLETNFPSFSWECARKLEYSPLYLGVIFFMFFLHSIFPHEISKKVVIVFSAACALMGCAVVILPIRIGSQMVIPMQIVILCGIIYYFSAMVTAVRRKREGSLYILAGFVIIMAASINDMLYANSIIYTSYLMPFGLFLFIFSQSLMIAMRFSQSFKNVASLSSYLSETNKSLNRFVPHEFLEYLGRKSIVDVRLGDQMMSPMTIMFIDIRNFATVSEKMSSQEVINFLNAYLSLISPVIRDHKGFVDKYIGDAVMALFPDNAEAALDSAIAIQKLIRLYSAEHAREPGFPVRIGIGLHSGNLMLCTIGDETRLETTVISDAVNLASRIENLTKTYGSNILVSENLFLSLPDKSKYRYRYLDKVKVKVKGKNEAVTIVEILDGLSTSMIELNIQTKDDFERAVKYYQNKQIAVAHNIFEKVLWTNPRDIAAQMYIKRCSDRRKRGDLEEWDGIEILDSK